MALTDAMKKALTSFGFKQSALDNIENYAPLVNMLNQYESDFKGTGSLFGESTIHTHQYSPSLKKVLLLISSIKNSPEYLSVGYLIHEVSHALWDREFSDELLSASSAKDYAELCHQNEALAYYRQILMMNILYSKDISISYQANIWLDNEKIQNDTDIYQSIKKIVSWGGSDEKKMKEIAKYCADLIPIAYGGVGFTYDEYYKWSWLKSKTDLAIDYMEAQGFDRNGFNKLTALQKIEASKSYSYDIKTLVNKAHDYFGTDAADTLYVEGMGSVLGSIEGREVLWGGGGNDTLNGRHATKDTLIGGSGNDTLYGYGGDDILAGNTGDDKLFGGDGEDKLYGGEDSDELDGGGGNDYLYGGKGSDRLYGRTGVDYLYGEDGDDTLDDGGVDKNYLYGGNGDDIIKYIGNNGHIYGGNEGTDYLGSDKDTITVTGDSNIIYGGAMKDTIKVTGNDNKVYGGHKDYAKDLLDADEITVIGNNNHVYGGMMDDAIDVTGNGNYIYGGDAELNHGQSIDEPNDTDVITVRGKDNHIFGAGGVDHIYVTSQKGEKNYLYGDHGDDKLYGGDGDDTLDGGAGKDYLYGGNGYDTYIADEGDTISDSDGDGEVKFNGMKLGDGNRVKDDPEHEYMGEGGIKYYWDGGSTLLVNGGANNGGITIEDFVNEQNHLGINLKEEEEDDDSSAAVNPPPPPNFDPLVLDLDGDGLETVGVKEAGAVMFDLDADGVKTKVGWVRPDDGLLVLDRNNNGTIDNGRELFGDATIKRDGTIAKDGFEALADLDTNGDGIIDTGDTLFTKLRVWKDLNSNGISEAGELFTLSELGIAGFDLGRYAQGTLLDNGNRIADLGKYYRTDGTEETLGTVAEMGELFFSEDPFIREFDEEVVVAQELKALPGFKGSGRVRDLLEAATLSPALADALRTFATTQGWLNQRAQTSALLSLWADTAVDFKNSQTLAAETGKTVLFNFAGETAEWVDGKWQYSQKALAMLDQLKVYEAFLGRALVNFEAGANNGMISVYETTKNGQKVTQVSFSAYTTTWISFNTQVRERNFFNGLAKHARNADLSAALSLVESGADSLALDHIVQQRLNADPLNTLLDIVTFTMNNENRLEFAGKDPWGWALSYLTKPAYANELAQIEKFFTLTPETNGQRPVGYSWDNLYFVRSNGAGFQPASGENRIIGIGGNNYLHAGNGNDLLHGGDGDDSLHGYAGNDKLYGGTGNDVLDGGAGDDWLYGGAGNDSINGGSGDNFIVGGEGSDYINGIYGRNTYYFEHGWGQDWISSNEKNTEEGRSSIYFGKGIKASDIEISQNLGDLLIRLKGSTDQIKVSNFFDYLGQGGINGIRFADGSMIGIDEILAKGLEGTDGDDNIWGYSIDDVIHAGAGNDTLWGRNGDDQLYGEDGNDYLKGESGDDRLYGGDGDDKLEGGFDDDFLEGGAGNDTLIGGYGSDTYFFEKGWGKDIIDNFSYDSDKKDVIRFGEGISALDIVVLPDSNWGYTYIYDNNVTRSYLILMQKNTGNYIAVKNYWADKNFWTDDDYFEYRLEEIHFADGTVWTYEDVREMYINSTQWRDTQHGTDANDVIVARVDNNNLYGYGGDDYLYGGNGDDYLVGGEGDDTLNGGLGSDTFYFERGWGQDIIKYDFGKNDSDNDIISFGEGIHASDLMFFKTNINNRNSLLIRLKESPDQIYIEDYFSGTQRLINEIHFADGTVWTEEDILQATKGILGSPHNDTINGGSGEEHIYGGTGNDKINGGAGNDNLYGEDGDDNLYGGEGDDLLVGGAGNDYLNGDKGSDTYYFERGWGQDRISNDDFDIANKDAILFGAGINAGDIELSCDGENLIISLKGALDKITVYYFYSDWKDPHANIDEIRFADGTVWTADSIRQMKLPTKGTDGDDYMGGVSRDEYFIGGAGNDTISGGYGNDTYYFERGWGQDTVYEDDGQDKFLFGEGISADQLWFSYKKADMLDSLMISLIGTGDSIEIRLWPNQSYDTRIEQFITSDGKILSYKQVDALVQAMSKLTPPAMGQTSLTPEQRAALASALAACWRNPSVDNAAPVISGSIGNQKREQDKFFSLVLPENLFTDPDEDALTYNVTLADGSALPSWLTFDAATRTLSGTPTSGDVGSFNFKITATDLYGLSTSQNVLFEVTAAVTNQNITGTSGNDTLQGGAGNDTLQGGLGDDTYIYSGGIDTIIETGGKDTLVFGNGITFSQVGNYLNKTGNDLILKVNGSAKDQVIIKDFFTDAKRIIETIRFETGGSISAQQIFDVFGLTMPVDNGGGTTDPTDPTDPGEPGFNTNFVATTGDDNYLYTSGSQTINELGGTDTLTFGNGITFSQVGSYLTKSSNDLILKVGGSTTNQVRIKNFFLGGKYLLENISFETGGNLTAQQIFGAFGLPMPQVEEPSFDQTITGTSGNDTNLKGTSGKDLIKGLAGNDNLYGLAGNDQLEGGAGNDRLEGGAGNDLLMGGTGDDTYVFARGFGQDVIDNTGGGNDTIYFDGINFNEVGSGLTKSGDDLILKVNGTSDQVTIKDWFTGGENVVQTIQFSTGGSISANQIFGAFGLSNPNPVVASSMNSLISAMAAFGSDSGAADTTQNNAANDPHAQQLLYAASLG